jgi:hypothetical protein
MAVGLAGIGVAGGLGGPLTARLRDRRL